ncbi:MAG: hypothetical protein AB7O97_13235 [Planctomycetota bacterium]
MDKLIDFLRQNPIVALLILGWIASGVGKVFGKRNPSARRPSATPPRRVPTAASPPPPLSRQHPVTMPSASRQPVPTAPVRRVEPTQDEVMAEMRRILGMEPRRAAPQRKAPAPAQPVAARRNVATPEAPPQPLRGSSFDSWDTRVDPHVGEQMQQRRGPLSGSVGAYEMGMLGGRTGAVRPLRARGGSTLVDLSNLPRAIVLREIFDAPRALREWE